jgi:excisionase family DNA binding protein
MTQTAASEDHDILTVDEAAAFLRLSRSAIYKLLQRGEIPAAKVLDRWRFSRRQLHQWIEDQRKSA